MGLIQAFTGSLGGTFADQWKDFLTIPAGISGTSALFPAVSQQQNNGRGSNTKASTNIISNGSKIVVPAGFALLLIQEGGVTGLVTEPGGYEWKNDDQNSQSVFAGDGFINSIIKTSWDRFKFGGQPGAQQMAVFVNLKELPNNRFGTQSPIYWNDAYLNAQVGAVTRGSYTLQIVDPILFATQFVPANYLNNGEIFDFTDMNNPASEQLFNEVVSSLAPAFSLYTNDPDKGNRITTIQSNSIGFAKSLSEAVEDGYQWRTDRGLVVVKVALQSIEYDADTTELLTQVKRADALSGGRAASYMNQSVARGVEAAGENGGGAGLAMFGMGAGGVAGLVPQEVPQQQMPTNPPQPTNEPAPVPVAEKTVAEKITELKGLLDAGLISETDFEDAKRKALGL